MAFKLTEAAHDRWRTINAPRLVALVRAGAVLRDGVLIECPDGPPAGSEFCYRLRKAARPITPADPQYAKAWRRYHDTHDRAGRR